MGTRSITIMREHDKEIAVLYRQFDGYPSGHGADIAKALGGKQVVNGGRRVSAAALAHVADTLTSVIEKRDEAQRLLAEVLERIGQVTGVDLSTVPGAKEVTAALKVLDSLTSPADLPDGWHRADAAETPPLGPFATMDAAKADAVEHSDELPNGYMVACCRDGRQLAAMYVPPVPRGVN